MGKKKTHEEYVEELKIKNPTVEVVGAYIDTNTAILHHCLLHDVYWSITPSRALHGHGCKECKKDRFHQSRCKTHQTYIEEIAMINPDVEVIGEYIGANTPILHRCKIDEHQWKPTPSNILKGSGCPECRNRRLHQQRAKTQQQYETEVSVLHPTIKVLGIYINAEIAILHQCLIDGHIWVAKPGNILHGKGCPECAGNIKLTHDKYIERLKIVNPNIIPLESYQDAHTHILHKCLIDGYVWQTVPSSTLQGSGCPKCAGNIKKTHSEYVQELSLINPDIEIIGEYIDAKTPILHRCKLDQYEWSIAPSNLLTGQGCPACQESVGERMIRQWLCNNKIIYKYQYKFSDCKDKKPLPFDFYLPDFNICIEYDGIQHFQPVDFAGNGEEWAIKQFETIQHHDKIKSQYCKDNNISLLRVPYFSSVGEELKNFIHLI